MGFLLRHFSEKRKEAGLLKSGGVEKGLCLFLQLFFCGGVCTVCDFRERKSRQ